MGSALNKETVVLTLSDSPFKEEDARIRNHLINTAEDFILA